MLTIWTDEQGRTHVDPTRLLRRTESCAASRGGWRVLCFVVLGLWILTLGATIWRAAQIDQRHRAMLLRARTWLGEERARTRCLEGLLNRVPPSEAEIMMAARRARWLAWCVSRELEKN